MQANRRNSQSARSDGPKPAEQCLAGTELLVRAGQLSRLDRRLRQKLPAGFGEHVVLADLRARRAVFLASSSAWATRLRLNQQQLRDLLRSLGEPTDTVVVKVAPAPVANPPPPREAKLSPAAAAHIKAAAASLSDPELKASLLALAALAE